jgi:Caspase domain
MGYPMLSKAHVSKNPILIAAGLIAYLLLALCGDLFAQTRRAVLVGIDQYTRPSLGVSYELSPRTRARLSRISGTPSRKDLMNLDGAVNDARQLHDLLIRQYAFRPENTLLLTNEEATADHILDRLQSFLIDAAQPGDISVFYYAGHGSRILNKLTENRSGMDSTIIPADALLGVPDITSKELARIYAQAPKKSVQLTVIQDSCFSGGGARGIFPRKTREQAEDTQVWIADRLDVPPEREGVLVISASQDYQPAQELDHTDLEGAHGAFTWALLHALASSPVDQRVDRVFQRTRAFMQSKVSDQEPAMVALRGRNERTLLGTPADESKLPTVAVGYVNPAKSMLELNGGLAMDLHEGCELERIAPPAPAVRARITEVNGPALSNATLVGPGSLTEVHPGDLFRLKKWAAPVGEGLRVFVGPSLSLQAILAIEPQIAALRARPDVELVSDPTAATPAYIVSWDGALRSWTLRANRPDALPVRIDPFTAESVVKHLPHAHEKVRLSVLVPAVQELKLNLDSSDDRAVTVVNSPQTADYVLVGSYRDSKSVQYAWIAPGATTETSRNPLRAARPVRTDWTSTNGQDATFESASQALADAARQLALIAGWLDLRSPADDPFAYQLTLRDSQSGAEVSGGEARGGRSYKLALRRGALIDPRPVEPRRVYVFVIDSFGKGTLLFPSGNLENEFPTPQETSAPVIDLTKAKEDFSVSEPYGIDNFFLLTTREPIDDPETVFNFEGVRTRGLRTNADPLSRLLSMRVAGTRGSVSGVPTDWSIEHIAVRSVPPNQRR